MIQIQKTSARFGRSLVHLGSRRGVTHAVTKGGIELIGHEEVAVLKQHHGPMGISMETIEKNI
jgi:hypothetical protein